MKVQHTRALTEAIIQRGLDQGGLDRWARITFQAGKEVALAPLAHPEDGQAVNWEIVTRGIWRMSGGQQAERPPGVTKEMSAQLARVVSDMDAEMMSPATASAVIQVGLYQEVRYQQS